MTGYITFRNTDFTFVFDGSILRMIFSNKSNSSISLFGQATCCLIRSEPITIDEDYLVGHSIELDKEILFFPSSREINCLDSLITIEIHSFLTRTPNHVLMNTLCFSCQELNYIYKTNRAYKIDSINDNNEWCVSTTPFANSSSTTESFLFKNKTVNVHFSVSRTIDTHEGKPLLDFDSVLIFSFNDTDNISFVIELSNLAQKFVHYLCYRKDISFSSIRVYGPIDHSLKSHVADITFTKVIQPVDDVVLKKRRFIPYNSIVGREAVILKMISNNFLYTEHIPESYDSSRIMTISRFISIISAFEWEFRNLYPSGISSPKTAAAEQDVLTILDNLIETNTGKIKSILKHLKRNVGSSSLGSKIAHVLNDYANIIDPFANRLYLINNMTWNKTKMSERINTQRNILVHGNLDKDFDNRSFVDILLLERIILIMQFKNMGISDSNIMESVSQLFGLKV